MVQVCAPVLRSFLFLRMYAGGLVVFSLLGPLRVLIRLLRLFCSFLSTFVVFSFLCLLNACGLAFLSRTWPSGCGVSHWHACQVRGVFVCHLLRYFFMFKVLEPILGFSCVATATLLTPRHYHWACFSFRGFVCACGFSYHTCDLQDNL